MRDYCHGAKETPPVVKLGSLSSKADGFPIELAGPGWINFLFGSKLFADKKTFLHTK